MPSTVKKIDLDQSNFEDAVSAAISKRLSPDGAVCPSFSPDIYESSTLGVVAFSRLEGRDSKRVYWQEVAAELARETGVGVVCVANCDWKFDDRPYEEEATFIAFDLPSVTGSYRDDPYRNMIFAVDPATAPAQVDFDNLKRARRIVDSHVHELKFRMETLVAAGKSERDVLGRIALIEALAKLEASDREAVKAVLDLNFDAAIAAAAEPEVNSPRM